MTSRVSDHVITFHHYYYTNIHGRYVMDDGWNIQFDVCLMTNATLGYTYIYANEYPAKYTITVYIYIYIYKCIYIYMYIYISCAM